MSGEANYKLYRAELASLTADTMVVPYVGLLTSAVTFVEDGNRTLTEDGKINREKVHLMWNILSEFLAWQHNVYTLLDVLPLQQWVHKALATPPRFFGGEVTEEYLYDLSYRLRPLAGTRG